MDWYVFKINVSSKNVIFLHYCLGGDEAHQTLP